MRLAIGVLGLYGHTPAEVAAMPWRDVQTILTMHYTMLGGGHVRG